MKLKVSLQRPGGDVQDLLVTADASTTVGELAHYLRVCDPTFRPVAGMTETEPTLSLVREANRSLDLECRSPRVRSSRGRRSDCRELGRSSRWPRELWWRWPQSYRDRTPVESSR